MKAILVIDINDELLEDYEDFYVDYDLRATNKEDDFVDSIRYVEDCKLKPMPQRKKSLVVVDCEGARFEEPTIFEQGYNSCLDEIIGEE